MFPYLKRISERKNLILWGDYSLAELELLRRTLPARGCFSVSWCLRWTRRRRSSLFFDAGRSSAITDRLRFTLPNIDSNSYEYSHPCRVFGVVLLSGEASGVASFVTDHSLRMLRLSSGLPIVLHPRS